MIEACTAKARKEREMTAENERSGRKKEALEMSLSECDFANPESLERYAKQLEGMTFRDVLDLGIAPDGVSREYGNARYKGGLGTLIEERFFGYKANNDQEPDFPEAGVELKSSCLNLKKDGGHSAGERLSLTMIPHDGPIEDDLFASHMWRKSAKILLVYYERDKQRDKYDQQVKYVKLITPSEEDLKIIQEDYRKIVAIVKAGRAEELSESLTLYLGAAPKGASKNDAPDQYYPPHAPAMRRVFCFKRSYMDYILHTRILCDVEPAEPIIKEPDALIATTFEEHVLSLIEAHRGKTDAELCRMLDMKYSGNKAQWSQIVYALLGVNGDRAEEFEKANVSVRTVRIEERGTIVESLSLDTFRFRDLVDQDWDDSRLRAYFEETRFLFVSFAKSSEGVKLDGARFWSMSTKDIEGPLRDCWERTKDVIASGVELTVKIGRNGSSTISNNLPKKADAGSIAHVRPHTSKRGYRLEDGSEYGEPDKYGDELPDGRVMTKQSFWLNSEYVYAVVSLPKEDEWDDPDTD